MIYFWKTKKRRLGWLGANHTRLTPGSTTDATYRTTNYTKQQIASNNFTSFAMHRINSQIVVGFHWRYQWLEQKPGFRRGAYSLQKNRNFWKLVYYNNEWKPPGKFPSFEKNYFVSFNTKQKRNSHKNVDDTLARHHASIQRKWFTKLCEKSLFQPKQYTFLFLSERKKWATYNYCKVFFTRLHRVHYPRTSSLQLAESSV